MFLSRALQIHDQAVIALVGGGGKTTAMFRLADELAAQKRRVVTTTTTRLFASQAARASHLLTYPGADEEKDEEFIGRVQAELKAALPEHLLVVGAGRDRDKILGVPPKLVDQLSARNIADVVIVEADGARLRPFKAPAEHEPVVPSSTTLLIPVVGIQAVGLFLDDEHVHRPDLIARLAGVLPGETVTPAIIARVLAHPQGGLKNKPASARAAVLVNQVEGESRLAQARELARLLLDSIEIDAVAVGAVSSAGEPVRQVHRRVAAVVTAAGAGVRMQGRTKQLLPWRGKTIIENAVDVALGSEATRTFLMLGAHAQEIEPVVRSFPIRLVLNPGWQEGHASTIRAAVQALSKETSAALFLNADQPLLTSSIVDALIRRYFETGALIVAPRYRGRRGSPVLFDRVHFADLSELRDEQGGRDVMARYPQEIEWVDFADDAAAADVDTLDEYESLVRQAQ